MLHVHDKEQAILSSARYLSLNATASSPAAQGLVVSLAKKIEEVEKRRYGRDRTLPAHLDAIAAIVGGLLITAQTDPERWSRRSMDSNDYTSENVGYAQYMGAYSPLCDAGCIEVIPGSYQRERIELELGLLTNDGVGLQTRLRASKSLLSLAREFGITPANVMEHFGHKLPKRPLVLKKSKKKVSWSGSRDLARSGQQMSFKHDHESRALELQVKELNEFLDKVNIEGGQHLGYRRIFNQGDLPGFGWNKGGRLYSLGEDSYQRLKKEDRLKMRLNGEPVVEIDVRASFLTILYAWQGKSLDLSSDPYLIEGISRPMVKQWITMTLGHDKFHTRWPAEAAKGLRKKGYEVGGEFTAPRVGEKIIAKHPVLAKWPEQALSCFDLMFFESDAIVRTMMALKNSHDIPCLSVHDSIIVPLSSAEIAAETLSYWYEWATGAQPALEIQKAQ